jgi:CBS domain-containing protein
MSLMHFVDHVLPMHRRTVFLVSEKREFYGVLMLEDLKPLDREKWRETTVGSVMRAVAPEYFVDTKAMLAEAKILMRENGIGALGVINARGELVGYLQRGRLRKRN